MGRRSIEPGPALRRAAAALALCTGGMSAQASDGVIPTPYRPTVSNPAELPQPGWIEWEFGLDRQHDGALRRHALPYAAKLAFDENWGVIVGGDLQVRESVEGRGKTSGGDTTLMLKHRIATGDPDRNFGVELGFKAPTAGAGLGSGRTDWTINSVLSQDFAGSWRLDANLGATRLGGSETGQGRTLTQWAASLSRVAGEWTLAGEISGQRQGGVRAGAQWLVAASYALSPHCMVDAGFRRGLQGWRGQHALFVGGTWLVGRLF